ncbi:MAG TPA: hypothetical protein VHN80_22810, partial [Kineosporiaceae bacterium]|nr:hypothetical protein [Kineosporiaceae bacterium]
SLPVLRPQPDEALAVAATASRLVGRACALARWLGPGRALTPAKVLRPADAAAAVAELGLDRPVLPADATVDPRPFGRSVGSKGPRARSAKHLPALHPIWSAAVAAGLIELRGQKAVPGPALALWSQPATTGPTTTELATDDAAAAGPGAEGVVVHRRLDSWARMLAGYLRAHAEMEAADELWFAGPRQLLLPMSAVLLYTADDTPLTPATLAVGALIAAEEDDDDLDPMLLLTLPEQVARWTEILQVWAMAGAVTPAPNAVDAPDGDAVAYPSSAAEELTEQLVDEIRQIFPEQAPVLGPLLDALRQGPPVTVTPCGRDLLARVLRGQGLSVPTVGDLADTPPEELLLALSGHHPEAAADEIRIWLDARGQAWPGALRELVASASGRDDEGPLRRAALPLVIALASQAAASMIPEWQQDPWLAVPVALGLAAASRASQPAPGHLLWMAVDMLSTSLDDVDEFADLVDATSIADLLATPGGLAVAVGLDHPHTRQVLRLLVDHLEDRTLARQLRRALPKDKAARRPKTRPSAFPLPGL